MNCIMRIICIFMCCLVFTHGGAISYIQTKVVPGGKINVDFSLRENALILNNIPMIVIGSKIGQPCSRAANATTQWTCVVPKDSFWGKQNLGVRISAISSAISVPLNLDPLPAGQEYTVDVIPQSSAYISTLNAVDADSAEYHYFFPYFASSIDLSKYKKIVKTLSAYQFNQIMTAYSKIFGSEISITSRITPNGKIRLSQNEYQEIYNLLPELSGNNLPIIYNMSKKFHITENIYIYENEYFDANILVDPNNFSVYIKEDPFSGLDYRMISNEIKSRISKDAFTKYSIPIYNDIEYDWRQDGSLPNFCQNGLYQAAVTEEEAEYIVDPTRDPWTGESRDDVADESLDKVDQRRIWKLINVPEKINIPSSKPKIIIIDSFDYDSSNYKTESADYHGEIVAEIISHISGIEIADFKLVPACSVIDGQCSAIKIVRALCNAGILAKQGDDVIVNMSLGGSIPGDIMRDAIEFAWKQGVYIIASSGNSYREGRCSSSNQYDIGIGDYCYQYPADWSRSIGYYANNALDVVRRGFLLSVGGIEINSRGLDLYEDMRTYTAISAMPQNVFSIVPPLYDILAPAIYYKDTPNGVKTFKGTSFSAAYVSGVVAAWMGKSKNPKQYNFCGVVINKIRGIEQLMLEYPDFALKSSCI